MLIALATSLKLPLSTTYVSFMVAMGASLADRAWGRDSAVYRISGVINVVGGWFATAGIAFFVAAVSATIIKVFQIWGIAFLVTSAAWIMYRSFIYHKKKKTLKESRQNQLSQKNIDPVHISKQVTDRMAKLLFKTIRIYDYTLAGVEQEDRTALHVALQSAEELSEQNSSLQIDLHRAIALLDEPNTKTGRIYVKMFDHEQDLLQSIRSVVEFANEHVDNTLNPLWPEQIEMLQSIRERTIPYLMQIEAFLHGEEEVKPEHLIANKRSIIAAIDLVLESHVKGIRNKQYSPRNTQLMFRLLLETKDLVAISARFIGVYKDLHPLRFTKPNPVRPRNGIPTIKDLHVA